MDTKKLTAKQYLKMHSCKYVMITYEFGNPIYVAPLKDLLIQVTLNVDEAELWGELDTTQTKLEYHKVCTGYKELRFEIV